jgi:hypothetical protein
MKFLKRILYSFVFIFIFSSYALGYDFFMFDSKTHIHKKTGTKYNENGFDIFGYDKDGYDYMGFNKDGIHKITKNKISPEGRDAYGFSKDEKDYYPMWYNEDGMIILVHPTTMPTYHKFILDQYSKRQKHKCELFDNRGFSSKGINKYTGTIYNKEGFTVLRFDKNGKHESTGTEYSKGGMDFFGRNKYGQPVTCFSSSDTLSRDIQNLELKLGDMRGRDKNKAEELLESLLRSEKKGFYDNRGFISTLYSDMEDITDSRGFDVEGWNHDTDSLFDKDGFSVLGFDKNGNHKETGSRYSPLGFDFFGRDVNGNYIANYFGPHRDFDFFGDRKPNFCLCCSGRGMRDVYNILKKYELNKF